MTKFELLKDEPAGIIYVWIDGVYTPITFTPDYLEALEAVAHHISGERTDFPQNAE